MISLPDITIVSQIYESANSLVYRGILKSNQQPVILKLLKEDYPTPAELYRYQQEYEITRRLNIEGTIKAYELRKYQNTQLMLLEDFGGESLKIMLERRTFELLTNQLPFKSVDALELVHCHIAKQPTPPHEINPEIPLTVSEIVMKLMAKKAEHRYQSAWGIKADLENCLAQSISGEIKAFSLGYQDISPQLQLPQKLYGRESQIESLLTAFVRVASGKEKQVGAGLAHNLSNPTTTKSQNLPVQGQTELMLISGYSGIGKSALVQELYKLITEKSGYFIAGKFDQLQRDIPYQALVAAFQELVRQLLTETQSQLQQWQEKIRRALGSNGQIISESAQKVLRLAACIGNQFDLPTLSIINETSQKETADELWNAIQAGFILPLGDDYKFLKTDRDTKELKITYKFAHDRIQQAAYSLILPDYKQAVHWKIGQLLLQNTPQQILQQKIFDIVNQLNFGIEAIDVQLERDKDETKMLPLHREANAQNLCRSVYFYKLFLCYLFQDYQQAIENTKLAEKYSDSAVGTIPLYHFYNSLLYLAIYSDAPKSEQKLILQKVKANQKKIKKWAQFAPMTHLHKFYLVEAERYRVLGENARAIDYYDRAIVLAKENDYINEEALANELAAKFYIAWGKEQVAQAYMTNAYYCYLRWGATAKMTDLERQYPELLKRFSTANMSINSRNSLPNTSNSISGETLDLAALMKASQAIASEIELDKLLTTLMRILLESCGAQTGYLILESQGQLRVEASGEANSNQVMVLQSTPIDTCLPLSIIHYVERTQEGLIETNVAREGRFTQDAYIKTQQPKSILCAPLLNQGQLIGIVYLENNLADGVFTPDRLEVIQLLSTQTAIALTNARLYTQVRSTQNRLNKFLNAIPVGISVHDAKGQIIYTNQVAQQLLNIQDLPKAETEKLSQTYGVYRAGTGEMYPVEQLPSHPSNVTGEPLNFTNLLAAMSKEWILKFYEAAIEADSELVFQLLEEIPESHAFELQTLRSWVNKFQFEKVLDLTEPLIGES